MTKCTHCNGKGEYLTEEELVRNPDYQRIVATIDKEVDYIDQKEFSHNIISLCLQEAASKFGYRVANDLVDEFRLYMWGWSKVDIEDDI